MIGFCHIKCYIHTYMHTYIYELNITSVKRWYLVNRANTACMVSGLSSLKWSMTYAGIGWVDSNCSTHAKDKQKRRSDLRTLHLQYIQRINSTNTNTHNALSTRTKRRLHTYIHTIHTYIHTHSTSEASVSTKTLRSSGCRSEDRFYNYRC